jgi:REP element-mobilizing transposase RayT
LRLADSLSPESYTEWSRETNERIRHETAKIHRELKPSEKETIVRRAHGKLEKLLDLGHGNCALRTPSVADAVRDALLEGDSKFYLIHSWVIMPNHLHAVLTVPIGQAVEPIAEGWRAATVAVVRRESGHMEPWHSDTLAQNVAGPSRFREFHDYILKNPARAGLQDWRWVGGEGIPPINVIERWGDLSIDR